MYGSAHNVFAQTFAGKGLVGLAALCWLLLEMGRAGWQRARGATPSTPLTLDVGGRIVLVATLALALYGVVQEVFYIPALLLLVFMIVGLAAGLRRRPRQSTADDAWDRRVRAGRRPGRAPCPCVRLSGTVARSLR